ncbi:MAG: Zn-dependent alcohol dehydrogenase [Bifidobacteriaceae bacterium]|jgi:S-(hydroxymethyl)glutathione dehydrogenase/alcohol dehydrogenase|nr:Zn-dependent alcohol dehydrogenase [Bifidobacteriaceae bacterium]
MKTKAAITEEYGTAFVVRGIDLDDPIGAEVLVEVQGSGLCHSDLTAATFGSPWPAPVLMGHEVAGVVVDVGPQVMGLRPGDRVVGCEVVHCGRCVDCVSGKPWRCTRVEETLRGPDQPPRLSYEGKAVAQFSEVAGFARHVLLHENTFVKVPDELPLDLGAVMGCGVVTGAGAAINLAEVRVGDNVAVIGCGGVGLSAVWGARMAGARRVIAVDVAPAKLDLASDFGATDLVDASSTDPIEEVRKLTGGVGVEYAFECVGRKDCAWQALKMVRETGLAYIVGMQPPDSVMELNMFWDVMIPKRSLRAVYMGHSTFKRDIPLYAEMYLQGRFPLDKLVSARINLAEINEGYAKLADGAVARSVITSF